ncbi:MAG: DUF488 domain-containing protein [Deferribacteraceae bacterium]|jgi:uncharacterized protein (DUF488 family)|nr:DUF488 domain-containing protein [Deferribacteraceae bacterium]
MLYKRQKALLDIVEHCQGCNRTKLMKVAFLIHKSLCLDSVTFYDFVPYKYGAYSFQLDKDIVKLCELKLLRYSDSEGFVTSKIFKNELSKEFVSKYQEETAKTLTDLIYEQYPYYTLNSVIREKNYSISEMDGLYTIGYEGRSIDSFVNILIQNNIKIVADVRATPLSRKYGFSVRQLESILLKMGIHYYSAKSLGVPNHIRNLIDEISMDEYLDLYSVALKNQSESLGKLSQIINQGTSTVLLCYENNHQECHRSVVAKKVETDKKVVNL